MAKTSKLEMSTMLDKNRSLFVDRVHFEKNEGPMYWIRIEDRFNIWSGLNALTRKDLISILESIKTLDDLSKGKL